ncbi:angiogenic factor with G patch and FHA domains 1-like isoform X2 [Dendronephthya gigantea]|uniref:angiogenic factor with G patch and FHA domains 1-like isoform X2 n=1 Tax=Dendronephthya gigantea TaxID=151771 RepID=UPI00106CEE6C|nr:angiogenic factor with G patch and FHA domains 1-like isoform X2 [Dendronephthya gigantea]
MEQNETADNERKSNDTLAKKAHEGYSDLEKEVSSLKEELETLKKKFERTEKLLEKTEFERESSSKYVESFREQVSQLHEKLAAEKKKNEHLEALLKQKEENNKEGGNSAAAHGNPETGKDIASSIREAAKDIATSIREAAQQATTSHGFVFDEKTGLYYDYNTGYYYNPNTRLYYDYRTGIYYTFNQERGAYEFYSQVSASNASTQDQQNTTEDTKNQTAAELVSKKISKNRRSSAGKDTVVKKNQTNRMDLVESGSEDGEIVEVEDVEEDDNNDDDNDDNDAEDDDEEEVKEKKYPPCIRAIVMQSDKLPVGNLNIITCMGLTFGRYAEYESAVSGYKPFKMQSRRYDRFMFSSMDGGSNVLQLSDIEVSKEHAKVYFDKESNEYFVKDLGSQNGTFINGTRISESKQESEGHKLSHGEQLKIGSTTFLLHIHPGSETCDECEPGQVQAQLKAKESEDEVQITRVVTSRSDGKSEASRKKELKRLKKRYMLENSEHEVNSEIASNNAGKYKDRAQTRRKKVGSETPGNQATESPSSVFKPIQVENKGRMMLEKMGWTDGEGLGKAKSGITEPVMATKRETGRGLGYGAVSSIDMSHKTSKSFTWKKTQDRYNAIGRGRAATSSQGPVSMNWVKKASKHETFDIFADDT